MNLPALLRYMQFYAHMAHNLVGGATFLSDHEFLAELYATYETAYDAVIERMIGLGEPINLVEVQKKAVAELTAPESFEKAFKELLSCEEDLCKALDKIAKDASLGTNNMLSDMADKSEMRQYKLKQRIK